VSPRSLADTTRSIPVKHDGKNERADGLQKTISLVFKRFIIMWLTLAQQRKCSNSTEMSMSLFSRTRNVVSSAYLNNIFITDKGFKSVAITMFQLVSAKFAFAMRLAARNRQKIYKTAYFSVQCHSRSLNWAPVESQCTTFY